MQFNQVFCEYQVSRLSDFVRTQVVVGIDIGQIVSARADLAEDRMERLVPGF